MVPNFELHRILDLESVLRMRRYRKMKNNHKPLLILKEEKKFFRSVNKRNNLSPCMNRNRRLVRELMIRKRSGLGFPRWFDFGK